MELRTFRQNPPWAEEEGSVWGNQRKIDTGVTPIRNSLRRSKMLCLIKVNMSSPVVIGAVVAAVQHQKFDLL